MQLASLLNDFSNEVLRLEHHFVAESPARTHEGYWTTLGGPVHGYSVIRLHDAWTRFCRQLVLVSARGNVTTLGGTKVQRSPVLAPGQIALDALRAMYPRRPLWEPSWFEPAQAVDAGKKLRIRNLSTVSAGLGVSQTISGIRVGDPEDLRRCRNYLAHRGRDADERLSDLRRRLGVPPDLPADFLPKVMVSGGATLFAVWCADLRARARAACQ